MRAAVSRFGQRRGVHAWFFVGPALLVTVILAVLPAIQLIQASVHDWQLGIPLSEAEFVGLDNFAKLFSARVGLDHAIYLSLVYTLSALTVEMLMGLGIALLLHRAIRGMSVFMALLIIPMVLMPAMVGMISRLYFSPRGLVNYVLGVFGVEPINWFSVQNALPAVIITDIWQWTPFFVLILLAGLQAMPQEPHEAAAVDGASSWQAFRHITLPLLVPLLLITGTLRVMELLRQFDVIFAMFGGGPGNATEILPLLIFRTTVQNRNAGVGAALSILLILIILVITTVLIGLMRRSEART